MRHTSKLLAFICLTILIFSLPVLAAPDLGWITLENKQQEKAAREILSDAFTRNGNDFLCVIESEQAEELTKAGIKFSVLVENADIASMHLVREMKPRQETMADPSKLSDMIPIGNNVWISSLSRLSAQVLNDDPVYKSIPLESRSVRLLYLPKSYATFSAGIEDIPADTLAGRVSTDSLYAFDERLMNFQTRYIWTDSIDAARDWMVQKFLDWGYTDVSTPEVDWNGGTHYNVMAIKPGYAEPDKVIVVGGHYDAITYNQPGGPLVYAPGADDDGSGTALTLELARIFADIPFRKTIIFMPFTAEEVGLVGSAAAADSMARNGTDVEVMYNYDMVAYDPSDFRELSYSSGANTAYRDHAVATASRVTPALVPVITGLGGSSDHASFYDQGFNIVNHIETDFNYPGWHTNADTIGALNFPFYTDVVRAAAASIGYVADAASPAGVDKIVDQGDGQAVEVFFKNCDGNSTYKIYWSTISGVHADSATVGPGPCSYVISGLTEGVTYYIYLQESIPNGYPSLYVEENTAESYVEPRIPDVVDAAPDLNMVKLTWRANQEADLSHYRIFRRETEVAPFELYQDNVTDTVFEDTGIVGQTYYRYRITAVDLDGFESPMAEEVVSAAATFDGGILVIDETKDAYGVPDEAGQEVYYRGVFGTIPIDLYRIPDEYSPISRSVIGQYSSVFYFDDEFPNFKYLWYNSDTVKWYTDYVDNVFISGFRTIEYWGQNPPYGPGELIYDEFGVYNNTLVTAQEFAGAFGQNGWPNAVIDMGNPLGYLPYISTLEAGPGAQVIFTYDSQTDDPSLEGQPVGLLVDSPEGYRIVLAFPIYHLTQESAEAIIDYARTLFGEEAPPLSPGDINRNGSVNISDVTYLVSWLFGVPNGPAPEDMNLADVNANCSVNIADLTYMVEYLFGIPQGPAPQMGCVNP